MSERFDVRLTEEEKKRLAELAKQKGISMTDLVRTWIIRGDVVHVLAEQLQDITNDFAKWHVLENRDTSIRYLCESSRGRMAIENEAIRRILFRWLELYDESFQLMKNHISELNTELARFIKQKEPKMKEKLIVYILEFALFVRYYHDIFVQGFMDILQNMDKNTQKYVGQKYNDEFRTRYNEFASKFEDFLKRSQRELGKELERAMPRAKEFRAEE